MATNFKYATIADLTKYFNRVNDFDSKRQIFNPTTDSNLHTFENTGYVDTVFINGEEFCDTLELAWRDNQRSVSCIPAGEYKARIRLPRESATRDYIHLLIEDVPDRSYILFHRGNTAKDSRGCVLVGQSRKQDYVGNSRLAMDLLMKEIIHLGGENIKLIIKNK